MKAHALLSPSAASRWLACTPSARLEATMPDKAGEAAAEGTLAHTIGELISRYKLGLITQQKYSTELKKAKKDPLYNDDLYNHADDYSVFVMESFAEAQSRSKDAIIELEHKIDITAYVPEGFGTGDCIIISAGILDIIDMKYGKGVLVSATNNKQMMLYALGALDEFGYLYGIEKIRMTIFQPSLENYSTYEITAEDLEAWAENELKPKAKLAFDGEGEFVAGPHCQFCKVRAKCRALAEYNLELAKHDFGKPELLNDQEIAEILDKAAAFKSWVSSVEEHALTEAVDNGKHWPGYKLVEGRSNRTYTDETKVSETLIENGWPEDKIFKPASLIGITAMEKLLTKGTFSELLGGLVDKPQGKPTLVEVSDKRPEWNSTEQRASAAAKEFEHVTND